ncbi:dihydrodipicolinate reductase [Chlamydia ibidis]|uniref:4-hydroxy-tetrahydrodipicolinate reductase n=2 Tax=Chlamydia ibidis TaxID=1405396 RepID=S7KE54_9CHLA|nr:4-hydroxy-tetrahydrodipicolinate reductase [Chlamydia ibidis]EPP34491.1 dihydrodipicolinate reductase [Chlamydia ibidis]EQM62339.1 dihydrodipicolinate reductase [Chlamydia ibidis 10-1398/6]
MKVGIIGVSGRMGTLIRDQLANQSGYSLGPGFSKSSSYTLDDVIENNDILVDFSSFEFTERLVDCLFKRPKPIILGTTGYGKTVQSKLKRLSKIVPIYVSSNTSLGAYIQKVLASVLAQVFDDTYDIRIRETHHRKKKDAISGTAMDLAYTIQRAKKEARQEEYSLLGTSENNKTIEVLASRVGNIPGEHEVSFVSDSEQVSICHTVFSREIFAEGVLRILNWFNYVKPGPGYYGPKDVFNIAL